MQTAYPNVSIGDIEVTLFVESVHGANLEFVLDQAEERTSVDYLGELAQMLESSGVDCSSYGAYGEVHFIILIKDLSKFDACVKKANSVVQKWRNKFNVNKMKSAV